MIDRTLRWRHLDGEGLQQVTLAPAGTGLDATGVVVGADDDGAFAGWFHIGVDAGWNVMRFAVHHTPDRRLALQAAAPGRWTDARGEPLPEFDGCVDIDISTTPFTNTLPIRRLRLREGDAAEIVVVYVAVPELTITAAPQRYTCLRDGRRYRFESLGTGFVREIDVDEDGLVVSYPGLFERVGRPA